MPLRARGLGRISTVVAANPQQSDVNMSNPLDGAISIDEGLEDIIGTVVVLL